MIINSMLGHKGSHSIDRLQARTALELCLGKLQLIGTVPLQPVVCSLTWLVAEVQAVCPVGLPLLTVAAVLLVALGHHVGIRLPLMSECHHQLWWTCTTQGTATWYWLAKKIDTNIGCT